jgi:hypothetical protein
MADMNRALVLILAACCAGPGFAEDPTALLACVVVPDRARMTGAATGGPGDSWRYQFQFDVADMRAAFDDTIARLEARGQHLGEEVSAMGDGSTIFYPCAEWTAVVETGGAMAEPGPYLVILTLPGG